MSPRGPGAVALTLGFTSLRSRPVPSLRWGCENTMKYFPLTSFSAPWRHLSGGCHLSDGCHLTHDYGSGSPRMLLQVVFARESESRRGEIFNLFAKKKKGSTAESA